MLCDNCGKRNANVRYTQIINGNKKEMILCEECSKKLGIGNMNFNMPINFSSFFSDFIDEFENSSFIPTITSVRKLKCNNCNLSFEEFINSGKFGCKECYNTFGDSLDEILKSIQGSDRHIGRIGKIKDTTTKENSSSNKVKKEKEKTKLEILQEELQLAIKEERYEDAASIRDQITKEKQD